MHLTRLLTVTARLVQEQISARLAPLNISYAQGMVLVLLYRAPGGSLRQTDIVDSLGLSRASGTLVLSQLEAEGLISRNHDPADARRLIISLTEESEDLEQQVHDCFDEVEQIVRRSLRSSQVEETFNVLRGMFEDVLRHRTTGA